MPSTNRPLTAAALASVLGFTVTIAARAQETAAAPQAVGAKPAGTRYLLLSVAGKPLPVRIAKEWSCHEDLVAGTLTLQEDGRWRLETTERETCGDRTNTDQEDEDGIYQTQGSTLRFLDDEGRRSHSEWSLHGDLDLDDLDRGTLTEDRDLTVHLVDRTTVLRFRREGA
jgi:hypothetical protein